jgi:feruloyl esterase
VSPLENRRNVQAVIARMGQDQADRFLRYFEIPGLAHGGGRFAPQWESLAALDTWVESGTPTDAAIVTDGTRSDTRGRTRPLCRFPAWPKYLGQGDPRLAASFACVAQ